MDTELRMPADRARGELDAGQAILVCAYDEAKCQKFMFEGALTTKQLDERLPGLPENTDVLFYCA